MKVLVTGSVSFIGSALALRLLERGDVVIGIDNHKDYYDPAIQEALLARFDNHPNYTHLRIDLADRQAIEDCFSNHKPEQVVNLAAQAGVRYSIDNPLALSQGQPGGHQRWAFLDTPETAHSYANTLATLGKTDTLIAHLERAD